MDTTWSYTSYKREPWCDAEDRKIYRIHFARHLDMLNGPLSWERVTILIAARKISAAIRAIIDSGKNPIEFHDKAVN